MSKKDTGARLLHTMEEVNGSYFLFSEIGRGKRSGGKEKMLLSNKHVRLRRILEEFTVRLKGLLIDISPHHHISLSPLHDTRIS